jgi:DNA-binding response OmpR family regulator
MSRKFDIIILDNWLPDLEGIDLCRQIRGFDNQTPIIFFSGSDMGGEERAALEAGANAYLLKGAGLGNLRETMAQQLGRINQNNGNPTK